MFKRLTWMTVGTGVGMGAALWGQRKVKAKIDRFRPAQVTVEASRAVRRLGDDLRTARDEGRLAMHRREAELRLTHPPPPDA